MMGIECGVKTGVPMGWVCATGSRPIGRSSIHSVVDRQPVFQLFIAQSGLELIPDRVRDGELDSVAKRRFY